MRPLRALRLLVLTVGVALAARAPLRAQVPERFENLKVLPTDIPRDSLIQIMRGFALSLGVRCQYCHVQGQPAADGRETMDFESDEKPEKEKARFMMRMVRDLNTTVLPHVPHRRRPQVTMGCVTCHRGLPVPTTLDRVLEVALDSGGAPAAVARYRQLREQTLEQGRYDFSETTVNELSRRLAARGRTAEAVALMEMNAELHPNSAAIDFQLGELHRARGETDRAIARYRMALEKDPRNQNARRQLDALTGAAPAPAPPRP
ncbi:MAG TPA: c-type cytochrome [Longimicrobiaceae bacterium]|nr:c-type cytochrome [Longimicrobiaceae bacterium]